MDKRDVNKFYYYEKFKKELIYFIFLLLTIPTEILFISRLDFINKSDTLVKVSILVIVVIGMIIAHFISKRICYHEGNFRILNNKAIIYLKNNTYEIMKDEVKNVEFTYVPGFRAQQPYYRFKIKYGNKKIKFTLDGYKYSNGRKIEEINLYRLYSFLNNNKKHK